jgi:hypothetical protein
MTVLNAGRFFVSAPWGHADIFVLNEPYTAAVLFVKKGKETDWECRTDLETSLLVQSGEVELHSFCPEQLADAEQCGWTREQVFCVPSLHSVTVLRAGDSVRLPAGEFCMLKAILDTGAVELTFAPAATN